MLAFLFAIFAAHAQTEKSAFESALEADSRSGYTTQERWIQAGDSRFRQVEIHGQKFYMKLNQRTGDFTELECDLPSGASIPSATEAGVQVYHRTKMFVQLLQETCERDPSGQRRRKIKLDPRMGFTIPDNEKSTIKNKKVFVTPIAPGVGFSGDW